MPANRGLNAGSIRKSLHRQVVITKGQEAGRHPENLIKEMRETTQKSPFRLSGLTRNPPDQVRANRVPPAVSIQINLFLPVATINDPLEAGQHPGNLIKRMRVIPENRFRPKGLTRNRLADPGQNPGKAGRKMIRAIEKVVLGDLQNLTHKKNQARLMPCHHDPGKNPNT